MKKLVAIVMVIGLVLVGGGLWVYFHPEVKNSATVTISGTQVTLPAGTEAPKTAPIIVMGSSQKAANLSEYLYLYDNRLAISLDEYGAQPDLGRQATRIWKSSILSPDEFNSLMVLITGKANDLKTEYFAGENNNPEVGDMDTILIINYQGINKTVKAASYFSPYSNHSTNTYAGMPSPLSDICQKLNDVKTKTVEFYRQNIS